MPFQKRWKLPVEPCILKAGHSAGLTFDTSSLPGLDVSHSRIKLRLRGDVRLHPAWMYEGGLPLYYRDIDDALTTETHHSRFALRLTAAGEDWPRRVHYKIQCPPQINSQYPVPEGGGPWRFTCWTRSESLRLLPDGCARIIFAHYRKKPGRNIRDINDPADETVVLDLPEGSSGWQQLSCSLPLGPDSAAMVVSAALEHACGTLWLEDLRLENACGFNILPPVDRTNRFHERFNWYGENLSRKEWTDVALEVNGIRLTASLFQRCFRGSENEIELPAGCLRDGENTIRLTNISDYCDPLPYELMQAELLAERVAPVRIAWCPAAVGAGADFGVLLKTYTPGVRVSVEADGGLSAPASLDCPEPGLHVLPVRAGGPAGPLAITVEAGGCREQARVERIVEKEDDHVLAGSGDAIYVPQETAAMEDFLIWYLENGLGSMLTFRPVYRWSGSRTCNEAMWRHLAQLLNRLGLSYCHMFDGRELPGLNANPTQSSLAGPGFLGCQAHERDGLPLLVYRSLGAGRVFFVNALEYPAQASVRPLYEDLLRMLGEEERARESRRGSLVSAGTVESAIYDLPDGARVIYAVNTDWYSDSRTQEDAVLRAGGYAYPVKIRRGMLHAFFVHGAAAAAACGMDTEILGLEERSGRLYLRVQGPPGGLVTVYRDNRETSLALRQAGVSQLIL